MIRDPLDPLRFQVMHVLDAVALAAVQKEARTQDLHNRTLDLQNRTLELQRPGAAMPGECAEAAWSLPLRPLQRRGATGLQPKVYGCVPARQNAPCAHPGSILQDRYASGRQNF